MSGPWTHAICRGCWNERNPDRLAGPDPLIGTAPEPCCFCGATTRSGIWLRVSPAEAAACGGHDDEGSVNG